MADMKKVIELYELKAEMLDESISPAQKQYYLQVAQWLEKENFSSLEDAVAKMRDTPYYLGGMEAKELDDVNFRIKAMEEAGYDDVAAIHKERREKLLSKGASVYTTSPDWINDFNRAQEEANKYARRKEIFGRIFCGYFNICGNPQEEHRKEAANIIRQGLSELLAEGISFDELASQKAYIELTMLTESGMKEFIDLIHSFMQTEELTEMDFGCLRDEQKALGKWVKEHEQDMISLGKKEQWHCANAIAVPSDDPLGYDFIAMKEVEE